MIVADTAPDVTAHVRPAPAPLAAAKAGYVAALLALLLVAAGTVAVRDVVVDVGWVAGNPWLPRVFTAGTELVPQQWMLPAGVAVVLVGVALVVIAVAPRRATATPVGADTAVYVRVRDVAKIAAAAALDVPGVLSVNSTASARRASVRCRVTGDEGDARALVVEAVTFALQPLRRQPRLAVRTRREEHS